MAERQMHGFLYEKKCFADFPWWTSNSDEYTNKWDGYDTELEMPVSIKCIQKGQSVEFGDMFRMASIDEDWLLRVGFWEVAKDNIVEEHLIEIDYSDYGKWEKFRLKYKELWGDSILQPRFKRDHGIQKRLQVGITHKNLKEHFNLN